MAQRDTGRCLQKPPGICTLHDFSPIPPQPYHPLILAPWHTISPTNFPNRENEIYIAATSLHTPSLHPRQPPPESSTAQHTKPAKMDAGKIPVKLVKVTRVLGRTGTPLLHCQILRLRLCINLWRVGGLNGKTEKLMMCDRFERRRDPSPCRVHG